MVRLLKRRASAIHTGQRQLMGLQNDRWFSVGICKYKPGYKSHDQL